MKKIIFILIITILVSCKKDKTTTPTTLNCKLKKTIHIISGGATDTAVYTYNNEDIIYTTSYSNTSTIYKREFIKTGNQYLISYYTNNVKTHEGFSTLNTNGFIDTSRITYIPTTTFNNREKNHLDANGFATRLIANNNNYDNDIKYHYINGNYSYWIYDLINFSVPANSTKDSIVFEYYLDKPKVTEKNALESKYGKLEKNLIKKRSFYDLLNSGNLKRTYEYEYLTDANGLVTREIWTIKNQPGNIETRRDTTYYEYICE